jgi:hypothetical protein
VALARGGMRRQLPRDSASHPLGNNSGCNVKGVEKPAQVLLRVGHEMPVGLIDLRDGRPHDPGEVKQLDAGGDRPGGERVAAGVDAAVLDPGRTKRRRRIASDEHAERFTDDEKREWERILGTAAGDPELFQKKRRDAQANAKLDALKDQRKVAGLPRQPLLAEPGSVQLPRFVYRWLVSDEARDGAWSLMDLGLLAALLGAFANDDPSVFVDGRFEGEGDDRALVVPGGVGSDLRMHGRIAGSPIEDGSGHVRVREALRKLALNKWVEVEQTVAETRIRLGEHALKLNGADAGSAL